MTKEDAAKILEYPVCKWSLDWDEREDGLNYGEAIKIAIYALRAQQTPLDRSRWEECPDCWVWERSRRFCPDCGRPLTEEAWAELERRIFGG